GEAGGGGGGGGRGEGGARRRRRAGGGGVPEPPMGRRLSGASRFPVARRPRRGLALRVALRSLPAVGAGSMARAAWRRGGALARSRPAPGRSGAAIVRAARPHVGEPGGTAPGVAGRRLGACGP